MKKSLTLFASAQAVLDEVKALDAKDSLTEAEATERAGKMAEATRLAADAKAAKADEAIYDATVKSLEDLGLELPVEGVKGATIDPNGQLSSLAPRGKSLGEFVTESEQFKALMAGYPEARIPEKSRVQSDPISVKNLLGRSAKSLFTGASDTSAGAFVVADQSNIIEMLGRRPLAIRDVISVRRTGSDTVEYVRQTSHTNNAAPTAEATSSAPGAGTVTAAPGGVTFAPASGVKPEGAWAFERDSAVVKTIAEWVPASKRSLSDVAALQGLIDDELRADLAEVEETEIVTGNGSGEHLDGIMHVSGTQAQAFSTDIFETVRKAITKVRTIGRAVPNGVGMNPADVESVDLARDDNDRFYGAGPFAMGPRTLWGYPIVESEAITAGTAVVADWSKAVLWDREQSTISVSDSHQDFFTRNLVAILAEERVAFAVVRPTAFVLADLTA